jgi:mannose-6-phosphate isomerase
LYELLFSKGTQILGQKHFIKYGQNTAVLCKYLDSAIRLPIQCHPDAQKSLKLFNSSFGKTECWYIISTRKINDEEPYILLGFKRGITPKSFAEAVLDQNISYMIKMLHKIPVRPGETYFVPARMAHAIGPGVFMLEVQEPSDWVIVPEQYCADIKLKDIDRWGALSPEQALQVFDYKWITKNDLLKKVSPSNRIILKTKSICIVELIGAQHTNAFGLWKVSITGKTQIKLPTEFAIIVVEKVSAPAKAYY